MAIDSANKRRSALMEGLLPIADNTVSTTDGRNLAWLYAAVFAVSAEGINWALPSSRVHYDTTDVRVHYSLPIARDHWSISP